MGFFDAVCFGPACPPAVTTGLFKEWSFVMQIQRSLNSATLAHSQCIPLGGKGGGGGTASTLHPFFPAGRAVGGLPLFTPRPTPRTNGSLSEAPAPAAGPCARVRRRAGRPRRRAVGPGAVRGGGDELVPGGRRPLPRQDLGRALRGPGPAVMESQRVSETPPLDQRPPYV